MVRLCVECNRLLFALLPFHLTYMFIVSFSTHRELGENMSDEELRAMIDEFDKDGDGESKT